MIKRGARRELRRRTMRQPYRDGGTAVEDGESALSYRSPGAMYARLSVFEYKVERASDRVTMRAYTAIEAKRCGTARSNR